MTNLLHNEALKRGVSLSKRKKTAGTNCRLCRYIYILIYIPTTSYINVAQTSTNYKCMYVDVATLGSMYICSYHYYIIY